MKASLFTAAAFAWTLASLTNAQTQPPQKPLTGKAGAQLLQKLAPPPATPASVTGSPSGGSSSLVASGSDSCTTPTPISGAGPFAFDTSLQTTGTQGQGEAICTFFAQTGIANDAWFAWTSGAAGTGVVSFCGTSTGDTKVAVYAGSGCPGAAALACNDDSCGLQSQVTWPVAAATTYTIQVGKYPTSATVPAGTFSVTLQAPPAGNNACLSATAISGPGPHSFNTVGATTDGPSNCGIFTNDVWFNWTSGVAGTYEVNLCTGASYDSEVSVYLTAACPAGTALVCDDDFCAAFGPSKGVFTATAGTVYKIQIGGYNGASGAGTFTVDAPPPPPSNDNCATFQTISGAGPFNFDTTSATTGTEGQGETLCTAFATTAVDNDIWYRWTAGSTGQALLSACGTTAVDTKIAAYPGSPACPTGGTALACNDDSCGLQSEICWSATTGQTYMVQMGTYPTAAGGTGTFGITVGPPAGGPCIADDGTAEDALGWGSGGEMAWVQKFGGVGSTSVSSIQVAWGTPAFPGTGPGNGSAAKVLLYDDPNNDGIPDDLVLIQQVNTTVANVDTGTFNTIPVTPVSLNGIFFGGAGLIHSAGQFVAPMDTDSPHCEVRSWFFGDDTGAAVDYTNPQNNLFPPDSFAGNGLACNLLVRAGCGAGSPMVGQCFPGTGGTISCPCGQPANPAGGCANHGAGATSGAVLSATGVADVSSDTLSLVTSNHRAPVQGVLNVFFSYKPGAATPTPGIPSGAGVRCIGVGGSLKRIYTVQVFGGTITKPGMGDLSVSAQSATFAGHAIVAPETRHYFNVYRDGQAAGPCGNTATSTNLTNMGAVSWVP